MIGSGGGLYLENTMYADFEDSVFTHNTAYMFGGAFYTPSRNTITFSNLNISYNKVQLMDGGGIYGKNYNIFWIVGCTMISNIAYNGNGGFMKLEKENTILVSHSYGVLNMALGINNGSSNGGFMDGGQSGFIFLQNSQIQQSVANFNGGAFYLRNSELQATNVEITQNIAKYGNGGAFYINGLPFKPSALTRHVTLTHVNCTENQVFFLFCRFGVLLFFLDVKILFFGFFFGYIHII